MKFYQAEMEAFDFIEGLIEDMIQKYQNEKVICEKRNENIERTEGKIEALEELLAELNKE